MVLPDNEQPRQDGIDFLVDSYNDAIEIEKEDGTKETKFQFNPEIAWFQGHLINQPFGRHAFYIKRLETLAKWCYNFMCAERAKEISDGLLMIRDEYKRSIDGKSSETYRDKDNNQNAVLNLLFNKTIERKYSIKGQQERSIVDAILHRDKARDTQND